MDQKTQEKIKALHAVLDHEAQSIDVDKYRVSLLLFLLLYLMLLLL